MVLSELLEKLVGREISFVRLAANSLLICVECEPGDGTGFIIWLEPTWHVSGPDALLAGSRQAQVDEEHEREEEAILNAISHSLHPLLGRTITSVRAEPVTNDLIVDLDGGYEFRTFVSDPTDDHTWHICDNAERQSMYASPQGFRIRKTVTN